MDTGCAIHRAVDLIAKRWSLLIILETYKGKNGKRRFSELKKSLPGVTPKILSERLKELESEGMLNKRIDSKEIPVKSIYSLTPKGKALIDVLMTIKKWSIEWNPHNKSCKLTKCSGCGR
jgi:DNA-binding HxlR family transcriptional regulator